MSERGEHESWLAQHAPFAARTALGENEAVCALRAEALSHARALGLPTTRDEDWRYTRLAGVAKHSWTPAPAAPDTIDASVPRRLRKQAIRAAESNGVKRMASTS